MMISPPAPAAEKNVDPANPAIVISYEARRFKQPGRMTEPGPPPTTALKTAAYEANETTTKPNATTTQYQVASASLVKASETPTSFGSSRYRPTIATTIPRKMNTSVRGDARRPNVPSSMCSWAA